MKFQSKILLGSLGLLTFSTVCSQNQPNILYIMSDDHGTQAMSCYGHPLSKLLPTPNIDRIASEGMLMQNCFVTNSISTPSRACILTGQYSHKNGAYTLNDPLEPNHPNVAKELQKVGYQTALVGKWHLHKEPSGFNYSSVLIGQGEYYNPRFIDNGNWNGCDENKAKFKTEDGYCTDIIADKTIQWLDKRDKSKPFFMACHFKAPHRPCVPAKRHENLLRDVEIPYPANFNDTHEGKGEYTKSLHMTFDWLEKADLKGLNVEGLTMEEKREGIYQQYMKDYLRVVAAVDENVGRLLKYLDDNGLTDNTIVVYTSDQGFFLGEHGWFDKRIMYEQPLKMPFMIRYPKEIKPKTTNKDFLLNIDFAPTFLDYAGVKKTPAFMQGESFRKNLVGKTPANWRKSMYYRYWMNDDYPHHVAAHYGVRTERYKLIYFYGLSLGRMNHDRKLPPCFEFYDLAKDPEEIRNEYNNPSYKKTISSLKIELLRLKKQYDDEDRKYPEMIELNKKMW
jgi:arylsulfatase A-like enzyme